MGNPVIPKSKLKRACKIFLIFIFFIYGIICMALAIQSYNSFTKAARNFELITYNWKSEYIDEIQLSATGTCPSGFEVLWKYHFPGTKSGCDCITGTSTTTLSAKKLTKKIYESSCTSNQTLANCNQINMVPSQIWTKWGLGTVSDQYSTVCAKKIPGYSFGKKHYINGCAQDEQKCGGPNKDYLTCVPKSRKCPIVDIAVGTTNPSITDYPETPLNFFKSPTNVQYQLYYSRTKADTNPIVETRIREGDYVCRDNSDLSITQGRDEYPLMLIKKQNCQGDPDKRFKKVSEIPETTFYALQGASDLSTKLPWFSISLSFHWSLFQREVLYWKTSDDCRMVVEPIQNNKDEFDLLKLFQLILMVVNIIACIIISIILTGIELANMCGCDVPCISGKGENEAKKIQTCKKVMKYLFKFLQAPFMLLAVIYSGLLRAIYRFSEQNKCGDQVTNIYLKDFANQVNDKCFKNNITQLVLLILLILLDIVLWCRAKNKQKKERQESMKKQKLVGDEATQNLKSPNSATQNNQVIDLQNQQVPQQPQQMQINGNQQIPNQYPGFVQQQPGVIYQQPVMMSQQPGVIYQQPLVYAQQPGVIYQQPGIYQQQPGYQIPLAQQVQIQPQQQPQQ